MRDAPCHNYSISHTAPLDECKCGWPKRDHGVRKSCPTCEHKWLDTHAPLSPWSNHSPKAGPAATALQLVHRAGGRYNKDECPKCLTELSKAMRRVRGEASTHKQPPTSAMESASGQCSKGGPHRWRFGKCAACGKAEGVEAKQRQIQRALSKEAEPYLSAEATRQSCPTCGFGWHDAYGEPECPKCLQPLGEIKPKRCVGEVSTYKHPPISAMESMSGACPVAGVHSWRFGKCTHCGKAEGNEAKEKQIRRIEDVEEARRERVEACKRSGLDYDHLGEARICKLNTTDTPKICPHCTFAWHDAYGKNECPKCLRPLVGEVYVRAPGHDSISTNQQTQRQVFDEPWWVRGQIEH